MNLSAQDKRLRSLTCCFAKAGTATVSVTAHVVGPGGLSLDVSDSKDATVVPPEVSPVIITDGVATLVNATIGVFDAPSPSPSGGIVWSVAVTTPTEFGSDRGKWGWAQIVQDTITRVHAGVTEIYEMGSDDPNTGPLGWFTTGIDGGYPAPFVGQGSTGGYFVANDDPGKASDYPRFPLDSGQASSYSVREDFTDYLMYTPPGDGSQPVPLRSFTWYYQGNASYVSNDWVGSGLAHGHGSVNSNPPFPDWDHKAQTSYDRWRTATP